MGRKIVSGALILLGALLIAAAALLVLQNMLAQSQARETAQTVMAELEIPEKPPIQSLAPDAPELVARPDHLLNPNMPMPEAVVEGAAYIGVIQIPVLALELPVISETTPENLQKAPCRFAGSAYLDNLVIGAHNYDAHFGGLKNLSYGDQVIITDLDGNVFYYRVADMETLRPDQAEDLVGGSWPLTLYTCTLGGRTRVVIRCEKQPQA